VRREQIFFAESLQRHTKKYVVLKHDQAEAFKTLTKGLMGISFF